MPRHTISIPNSSVDINTNSPSGNPRPLDTSPLRPPRKPTQAPLAPPPTAPTGASASDGGPPTPLVGTSVTTTVPSSAPAPRPRAQTWTMGQTVGAGGALINYRGAAVTNANTTTSSTSTTHTNSADPNNSTHLNTTDPNATGPNTNTNTNTNTNDPDTNTNVDTDNDTDNDTDPDDTDVQDPVADPPLDPMNKPWPNPENPSKRHLRIAAAGIGTKPGASDINHRDNRLNAVNAATPTPADMATVTTINMALDDASTALKAAFASKSEHLQRQQLDIAFARLLTVRANLQDREPRVAALKADQVQLLKDADADLQSVMQMRNDPSATLGQKRGALDNARLELDMVHRLNETTVHPDSLDAALNYLDINLADADRSGSVDGQHFQKVQSGEAVQKVYVAPEWMFRRPEGQPPYTTAEFNQIKTRIEALSAKYPDWVIVPGTVFYGDKVGDKYQIHNEGFVAYGGDVRIIRKQNEADLLDPNTMVWAPGAPTSTRFEFDGYKYAVEICRDHPNGVTLTESAELVDYQIVTANDVFMTQHSLVVRDGGVFIIVDGNGGSAKFYRVKWKQDPQGEAYRSWRQKVIDDRARIVANPDLPPAELVGITAHRKKWSEFYSVTQLGSTGKGEVVPSNLFELEEPRTEWPPPPAT